MGNWWVENLTFALVLLVLIGVFVGGMLFYPAGKEAGRKEERKDAERREESDRQKRL